MKSINHILAILLFIATVSSGCNNQRFVSTETDDIYYSSADRALENGGDFNSVQEVSGEDYKSPDNNVKGDYYSIGREVDDQQNPNAERAYAESQRNVESEVVENESTGNAETVNNFYGNTTYAEGDYYDESYASRIRRFDQSNAGFGYYDPFFIDPYRNYGWSAWNPYPRAGWSVGYNSWSGWNAGFNQGWGYPAWGFNNYCSWNAWNNPYFNNSPYMNGFYGGMGYYPYGFGYNPYRDGYWNGYRNGYFDGSGWGNNNDWNNNSRQVVNSRTGMVGNSGFSGNVANDVRDSRIQNRQTLESTGLASNRNVVLQNEVIKDRREMSSGSSPNNSYDLKNRKEQLVANSNSNIAATKYSKMSRESASSKYDLAGSKAQKAQPLGKESKMTREREVSSYAGSGRASYQKNDKMGNTSNSTNRVNNPSLRPESSNNSSGSASRARGTNQTQPTSRTSTPSSYKSPRDVSRPAQQPRSAPSMQKGTRTKTSTPTQSRTRVSQPQRNRSNRPNTNTRTAPSRNKSNYSTPRTNTNVNRSSGSSQSSAPRMSAPSRSSSPSSSPSRGSSPSRSSGGRR
jgi:hypothetical protein